MSLHYFSVQIATQYGLKEAIVLQSLGYWLEKNVQDKRNFKEGRAWTFNSVKDMQAKYFPYFTEKMLYGALHSLIKQGIILKGNFNKFGYDKTTWYTLTTLGESILGIDVHTVPEQEAEAAGFANNLEAEQRQAEAAAAMRGSEIEQGSKTDGAFREKRENGSSVLEKSTSPIEKLEAAPKESGSVQAGAPIPVTKAVTNTLRENIVESTIKATPKEAKPIPVKEGWLKFSLEELKAECPLLYEAEFKRRSVKLYGSAFDYRYASDAQRQTIDALMATDAELGKLQIPQGMWEFEQKVKADPSILPERKESSFKEVCDIVDSDPEDS